ncbi:MAG: hypothetical protein J7574_09605 [Flavobacterium sp.]|uniref:hypothetical protein n=1 Tax=Flavobacterium sp. TaxID=239 RepID=UPI001B0B3C91|nr:hypothetical protein [Flavobacterium sp.]MBO9584400.1 hypothetical protein [Flavobacterium sp.]
MKRIVFILIFWCFISCEKRSTIIDDDVLDKLSKAKYEMPSIYGQESLFVSVKNFEIIKTNADFLNYLYELKFKKAYKSFKEFLDAVLNHKIEIDKNDFKNVYYEVFILSDKITKEYEKGFNIFYTKYTEELNLKNKKIVLKKTKLNKDEFLTIQYYFYLNGYQIQEDDYNGFYYVVDRETLFK